jgi:hypothetical protein
LGQGIQGKTAISFSANALSLEVLKIEVSSAHGFGSRVIQLLRACLRFAGAVGD